MQRPAEQRTVRKCEHLATDKRCLLTGTSDGGQTLEPHHDRNRLAARAYDGGNPRAVDPPHPLPRPAPEPSFDVVVVESSESTSIPNSPRPRPSTRQRRSGIPPSSARVPGPPSPAVRLRPERSQPATPRTGTASPSCTSSRSTTPPDQCCCSRSPSRNFYHRGNFAVVGTSYSTKRHVDSNASPVRRAPCPLPADDAITEAAGRLTPPRLPKGVKN